MTIILLFVAFFLGLTIGKLAKSDVDAAKADAEKMITEPWEIAVEVHNALR